MITSTAADREGTSPDGLTVVVGCGLAGAAAAWRLVRSGHHVVLIEAVEPAHGGGSSHGSARIFRHAYPDAFWAGATVAALQGWRQLEQDAGEALLRITGGLDVGSRRDLAAIERALAARGLPHEVMGAEAARARWPWLAIDGPALHQPGAGVIDSQHAVEAMVAQAVGGGAELIAGDSVTSIEDDGRGVEVHLVSGRRIRAAVAVVAVGAWLPELLPALPPAAARLVPPLAVTEQHVFHFRFPEGADPGADWPVFVDEGHRSVYALPGGRDADEAGFKIAEHDVGTPTTASGRSGSPAEWARRRIVDYVRRTLPSVDPTPYAETTCLYTRTPDEDFVIDRVGRVVVASPCSGHGAKFAPLTGAWIAAAVEGRLDAVPERFRRGARSSEFQPSGAAS